MEQEIQRPSGKLSSNSVRVDPIQRGGNHGLRQKRTLEMFYCIFSNRQFNDGGGKGGRDGRRGKMRQLHWQKEEERPKVTKDREILKGSCHWAPP